MLGIGLYACDKEDNTPTPIDEVKKQNTNQQESTSNHPKIIFSDGTTDYSIDLDKESFSIDNLPEDLKELSVKEIQLKENESLNLSLNQKLKVDFSPFKLKLNDSEEHIYNLNLYRENEKYGEWKKLDFPYSVAYYSNFGGASGTFINSHVILTCAHSFSELLEKGNRVTAFNLFLDKKGHQKRHRIEFTQEELKKVKFILHPEYSKVDVKKNNFYDLALIILPEGRTYMQYESDYKIIIPNEVNEANFTKQGNSVYGMMHSLENENIQDDFTGLYDSQNPSFVSQRLDRIGDCYALDGAADFAAENNIENLSAKNNCLDANLERIIWDGNSGGSVFHVEQEKYYLLGTASRGKLLSKINFLKDWLKSELDKNGIDSNDLFEE